MVSRESCQVSSADRLLLAFLCGRWEARREGVVVIRTVYFQIIVLFFRSLHDVNFATAVTGLDIIYTAAVLLYIHTYGVYTAVSTAVVL